MNLEQIKTFEMCSKHLKDINVYRQDLPFNIQKYGCGSQAPAIEHSLERIHRKMFEEVALAIDKAEAQIKSIIEKI